MKIIGTFFLLSILLSSFSILRPRERVLTQSEIKELIDAHNFYRKKVGVPEIRYSNELSLEAKKVALMNAKRQNLIHTKSVLGENLYFSSSSTTPKEVVDDLASEEEYFSHRNRKFNSRCGHYTQIIWKSSLKVGAAIYLDKDGGEYWALVYSPAGNQFGEKAY